MAFSCGYLCHSSKRRNTLFIIIAIITIILIIVCNIQDSQSNSVQYTDSVQRNSRVRHDLLVHRTLWEQDGTKTRLLLDNSTKNGNRRFPNALIIGVRKGGTRALIDMLKAHPNIVAATNEIHYFDRNENFAKGRDWYIQQMPVSQRHQITIEKSPSYFVSHSAPERVSEMSPNIKLILIVRNPIDRTVSDYTQLFNRKSYHRGSFEDSVFLSDNTVNTKFSPVSVSMYDIHFKRWQEYFDLEQILIVDGDTLISNPLTELKKAESFLEVGSFFTDDMFYFNATKGFYCWKRTDKSGKLVPHCLGRAKGRRHPQILNSTTQRLANFFWPHNENFFIQCKQRFNWGT